MQADVSPADGVKAKALQQLDHSQATDAAAGSQKPCDAIMPMQVRNAAPSVASVVTVSTKPLLPVLDTAPTVSSAACVAIGLQPFVQPEPCVRPVSAAASLRDQVVSSRSDSVKEAQLPAHRQPARLSVLPDVTANITMATKDAFACVNAMFGSSLSHAPNVTRNLASAVEPTVTISTKAAFEELNSMFSSDLPHCNIQSQKVNRAIGSKFSGRSSGTFARYQPNQLSKHPQNERLDAGRRTADAPASLGVYRDTQSPALIKHAADQTEGLAIYEDTEALPSKPVIAETNAEPTAGFAIYEDTGFLHEQPQQHQRQHGLPANATQGFQMYEDTHCLQAKTSTSPARATFQIHEDTACLQRPQGHLPAAGNHSPGGLGIYEDTQLLSNTSPATGKQNAAVTCSPVGLGIYEDTQFVSHTVPAPTRASLKPAAVQRHKSSSVTDEENVVHAEDKENCNGHKRCSLP